MLKLVVGARSMRKILAVVALLLLSACASQVRTKVNAFKAETMPQPGGSIMIKALRVDLESSLEFALYRELLASHLQTLGYTLVDGSSADYIALLDYSVNDLAMDSGGHKTVYVGNQFSRSLYGAYSGGVVIEQDSRKSYLRKVSLVIANNDSPPTHLYEVNGLSEGYCAVLSEVFDEILRAMLLHYPAANGSLYKLSIPGNDRC